jgi:D-alanine-D-alanine ligase
MGWTAEQVAEFDSAETIAALEQTIQSLGHQAVRIGHAKSLAAALVAGERWDLVFNIAEGNNGRGREAQVPCLLDLYEIPYTASDALVCAATLDKAVAKRLVQSAGLHTPPFKVVATLTDLDALGLGFPLFAKPIAEGTGKGIDGKSRIGDAAELAITCRRLLERFDQPVLVEEYLPGREFTTAILGTGAAARVIGTMEFQMLPHSGTDIYTYEMKEHCEKFVSYFAMPAGPLRQEVEALALASYRVLECRDVGRVDIRCDRAGRPSFLEVNPLPGMHPSHSDLPMIATQEGMSYRELIGHIIKSASERIGSGK